MSAKRSYGDVCGVARALDVVGERWALMIVRELLLGPKRFTDIRAGLPHLSADVLAQRLRGLEIEGVVQRRKLPPPAASQVYELTEWGTELESVILALGRWGARCALPEGELCMSFDSHILTFRTLFDPARAAGLRARIQLQLDDYGFAVEIDEDRFEIGRGELRSPDAVVRTDPGTLVALAHGRRELDEALAAGAVRIDGDQEIVARFLGLFPLPEPAV